MLSKQDITQLKQEIQSNQHEVFVISLDEMDSIVNSSAKAKMPYVQDAWKKLKGKAELGAGYYASADDLRTLSKLVNDLGGFATKAYVKTYGGKAHIILKGHPGLRKILTSTKYGIRNPQVVTMGLGKAGAIHAVKSGGIISVVLLSAYRIADYFFTDEATLSQLIGSLATDVVKVGIAAGASIVAASAVVGMGITLAIGPIAAVVIVGVGVSMALSAIDSNYGITDRVILGLDEIGDEVGSLVEKTKSGVQDKANKAVASVIDYTIDYARTIIIDAAKSSLDIFLSKKPRLL